MEHLQLLIYTLLLSTGFAGITVAAIFYHRTREILILINLVIICLFSLGLIFNLLIFYMNRIAAVPFRAAGLTGYINSILIIAVYGGIIICVKRVNPEVRTPALAAVSIPVAVTYGLFGIASWSVPVLKFWAVENAGAVSVFSIGAAAVFLGLTGNSIFKGASCIISAPLRFFIRQIGRMLFWYSIVSLFSSAGFIMAGIRFHPTSILNYFLYLAWNITAIIAFIRYLLLPVDLFADGTVPADTVKKYGISKREAEVVELISKGLSNKEIAAGLGISFTTARTHVYNIFQKTGAASRVELLRIISSR